MAMDDNGTSNNYEEARKQRLEENKKRVQDLGILSIKKGLSDLTNSEKKSKIVKQRVPKPKPENTELIEPRRSSRARNPVPSYCDDVDIELPSLRKRSRSYPSSWTSYVARPLDEIKIASYEEKCRALRAAENLQSSLQSGNPFFVKSMVRSHVYSCFWLGLPTQFCKDHLPLEDLDMILEDENGSEYDAKYIGKRSGLSGGWRGFALDHKLDDGDAVVFELVEPKRFKVYICRVSSSVSCQNDNVDNAERSAGTKNALKGGMKLDLNSSQRQKLRKAKSDVNDELPCNQVPQHDPRSEAVDPTKKKDSVSQELAKKGKSTNAGKTEDVQLVDKEKHDKRVFKPRKKPAPKSFRKRA